MGGSRTTHAARPSRRLVRALAIASAVTLVLGLAAAYQVGVRNSRPPSFEVGGGFATGEPVGPTGPASASDPGATTTAPAAASTTTPTPAPAATPTTAAAAGAATPTSIAADTGTTTTAAKARTTPALPATGTYTYSLQGFERATGFGSRSFPPAATLVVHRDPSVGAEELVHDLRLSNQHEERAVVRYGGDGVAFRYEGGSITFAPSTQTSQATYEPPMTQIPWPLAEGASRSGSSSAVDPAGGVTRVERWTATVVGREVVTALGQARETWVVDVQRNSEPGGAEQVDRFRRYWYDADLGTWVRWTERFRGQRSVVLTFSYETEYTAELRSFTAG